MTPTPNVFRRLSGIPDITRLEKKKTALLLVEFQTEHFTGVLPIEETETLIQSVIKMMDWADKNKIKVIHIRHQAKSPASLVFAPDSEGSAFYPPVEPRKGHEIQTKYASSAFSGSVLQTALQAEDIDTLILTGIATPTSISATAHDARQLGYKCIVAADLTASRDVMSWDATKVLAASKMQETALANISDKYAPVMLSADIMALPLEK